jgi:hypothetical protein
MKNSMQRKKFMKIFKSMFFGLLSTSLISTPSYADDDDFVKGLMGVMIGAAIANSGNSTEANSNNQKKSKKPSIRVQKEQTTNVYKKI